MAVTMGARLVKRDAMPVLVIGNRNWSSWSLWPWPLLWQFGVPFEQRMNSGCGVPCERAVDDHCDALFALPALHEWLTAARAEPGRLTEYESRR